MWCCTKCYELANTCDYRKCLQSCGHGHRKDFFQGGGAVGGFPKIFSRGRPEVVKFCFYPSISKKQYFFANNFKIQEGAKALPPFSPPFRRPCLWSYPNAITKPSVSVIINLRFGDNYRLYTALLLDLRWIGNPINRSSTASMDFVSGSNIEIQNNAVYVQQR